LDIFDGSVSAVKSEYYKGKKIVPEGKKSEPEFSDEEEDFLKKEIYNVDGKKISEGDLML
jgi:hypothetical protein